MKFVSAKKIFSNEQQLRVDSETIYGFEKKFGMKCFEGGRVSEISVTNISHLKEPGLTLEREARLIIESILR